MIKRPYSKRSTAGYVWMFFLLITISTCQSTQTPSRIIEPSPSNIPLAEQITSESTMIPSPTAVELPTVIAFPTIVEPTATLTPNGPWLVYLRYGLTIVNQDGTGLTSTGRPDEPPVCNLDGIQENPLSRLVIFPGIVYLVQPEAMWRLVYREWPTCHTDFTGNKNGGLLASIYQSTFDAIPELRIYELPSGKILDQFPLMKCSEQCNTDNVNWWEIKWSPDGRYLAFPAVLEGDSSDLYIYDSRNGNIRRLTTGPDHVGTIWWSPDGATIIMSEILKDGGYPYASSVWSVSLTDGDIQLLYSLDPAYPQGLLGWLDNDRFITFSGTSLANALDLPAYNLRIVDKMTSKVTQLFNGGFMAASLDQIHETIAVYAGGEVYMISTSNPEPRPLKGILGVPWWDDEVGLFVTFDPCETIPTGRKAFNHKGESQCLYSQLSPESLASPDGKWQVILQDGFWLKSNDQQPVRVSEATSTQIIWRLDSQGLFFIANNVLYYASLPDAKVSIVDKYPGGDTIHYQWVSND
jgi:hypothetical protein